MAKFGISENVKKTASALAFSSFGQERGLASEFELDPRTASTPKHPAENYG